MIHWTLDTSDEWVAVQYVADYRGCKLRVAYMSPHHYTAFVERRGILCTAHFKGEGSLHRAKLAAPKLANVMIQHSTTHAEPKGKKS